MAFRQIGSGIEQGVTTLGHNLSSAAIGVQLTYTVPAGRNAMLRWYSIFFSVVAGTVAVQVTIGGTTCVLQSGAANYNGNTSVALNSGDTCQLNVAAGGAGGTFDGVICVEERSNA